MNRFGVKRLDGERFKDVKADLVLGDLAGSFSGYGSVFDVVDAYNEIVAPGAFSKSIAEIAASGRALPVLWNHHSNEPIGKYTSVSEDSSGLKVEGKLLVDHVARAKEIAACISEGVVSGLSIGYFLKAYSVDEETGIWTLTELELREISVVTFPANGDARIETIKSKLAGGGMLTKREMEKLMRDAGLSKKEAKCVLRDGFSGYVGEGDPVGDNSERLKALQEWRAAINS